jgi:hypothetical protein
MVIPLTPEALILRKKNSKRKMTVRPEKANYLVQKAIDNCLQHGSFSYLQHVKTELNKLLEITIKEEYPYECDSYYDDDRSINTLMYISDRWRCTGRIKWLLFLCDGASVREEQQEEDEDE